MKRKDISLEILPMTDLSIELTQSDMATGDRESSSDTCECTIEVRHLHPNIEPAMLEMYFESAKSGGCNESVKDVTIISPEVAHVTFHKPEGTFCSSINLQIIGTLRQLVFSFNVDCPLVLRFILY